MKHYTFLILFALTLWALTAIEVSGPQSGSWTADSNPYQIVGDILVPSGSVLTIEAGVMVQAMGNFRINVEGSIQAVGTETDSIYFMNAQQPPTNLWKGLRLDNDTAVSNFTHCYIEYAEYGINAVDAPVEISHCRLNRNKRGIHLFGIGNLDPAVMNVHHNIIEYSENNGILIPQNSNAWVHHNEVRYNGTGAQYYGAIQLSNQSPGGQNDPIIEHNHVHHNLKQGITAWDLTGGSAINPTIRYNHIEANLTGIYLLSASGIVHHNVIINNFITGDMNSGAGMMIAGASSVPYIAANTITGNYTGFYITTNAMPVLGNLTENHPFAFGENLIEDNIDATEILNSVVCTSYTQSSNVIKAENNDWGVYTAAEIAMGIRDQNDDPALPTVDFTPWLQPQTPLTLIGTYSYDIDDYDTLAPQELQVLLVDADSGEILETHPLQNNPFSIQSGVNTAFYALISGVDPAREIWAGAGGLEDCTLFSPLDEQNINLGVIHIAAWQHYDVETTGDIQIIEGRQMWPVHNSFLVFAPHSTDYFYDEGDYRYIYRHDYRENGTWITGAPALERIYEKIQNFTHEEHWIQNYFEGGTALQRRVDCYIDDESRVTTLASQDGHAYSQIFNDPQYQHIYLYDESAYADRYLDVTQAAADIKHLHHRQNLDHPGELHVHSSAGDFPGSLDLFFWWQAPAFSAPNFNAYFLYRQEQDANPVLVSSVNFQNNSCWLSNQTGSGPADFWIVASDGTIKSTATNIISIDFSIGNEDLLGQPLLSIYPNPVSFQQGNNLKIKTQGMQEPSLKIYNIRGQQVYSQKHFTRDFEWQGVDSRGQAVGSGIYMLRLESSNQTPITRKIMVIK